MVVMQQSKGSSVAMPSTHGPVLPSRLVRSAFPGTGTAVRKKGTVPAPTSAPAGIGITSSASLAASKALPLPG
eukprot:scaffold132491_cov31-Tisochrysis_lutea.AAC.2